MDIPSQLPSLKSSLLLIKEAKPVFCKRPHCSLISKHPETADQQARPGGNKANLSQDADTEIVKMGGAFTVRQTDNRQTELKGFRFQEEMC